MEYLVTQKEQESIEKAIKAFEKKSSVEIVTVIAKQSDPYLFIPTLWAAIGALITPWIYTGEYSELMQLFVFGILAAVAQIKQIKMLLIPSYIKKKRSTNKAKEKFIELLEQNAQQNGLVMLYVSEAEKYVEILTDGVVAQKVEDTLWSESVTMFINHVQAGNIAQGYLETIEKAGNLLVELFPKTQEDQDTLPNHLILV